MKVLFVCNNAFTRGNGLSASVRVTIKELKKKGVDARLMATRNPDPEGPQPDFPLEHFKIPVFEPLVSTNGFMFARADRKVIDEAVRWADVVHFEEALPLEYIVCRVARKMGKARTATFHLFPHNVSANLGLPKKNLLNGPLVRSWRNAVFNHCSDIQCPTEEVERYLIQHHFKSRLHIISNGIVLPEEPVKVTEVEPEGAIDVLCIGRLASEKSQETLMQAMRYSKYAKRIHLIFAGNGPKARYYKRMAQFLYEEGILKIPATFGFYNPEELRDLARKCYLYIHCAWVEVEGLSCLEATREGIVPIIAEGDLIGTSAFALCPESEYPVYDSRMLASRIDWWIEHSMERNRMAQCYADAARGYDIDASIDALIRMFRMAVEKPCR
ncbi:MAG: glycosyltransferase [Bacteroidales bacterium]|nr:glycosyltransferase [Bacteroidales bacterium]